MSKEKDSPKISGNREVASDSLFDLIDDLVSNWYSGDYGLCHLTAVQARIDRLKKEADFCRSNAKAQPPATGRGNESPPTNQTT